MTVTFPLTPPDTQRVRMRLISTSVVGRSVSPFTFQGQTQIFDGQLIAFEVTCPTKSRTDADAWMSFLLALNGMEGTFYLGDNTRKTPLGSFPGTPLVKGGSQTGRSILIDGFTPSATNVLKAGDWIQIGSRIYRVYQDQNANGSGESTVDIWPRLRESPADNAPVIATNTVGLFQLASNEISFDIGPDKNVDISFTAIESL